MPRSTHSLRQPSRVATRVTNATAADVVAPTAFMLDFA